MAQGVRQPIHSITSLAVPIETDGNASAAGTQKQSGVRGGQGGEERGLAKTDSKETEKRTNVGGGGREACELHINPVSPDTSQQAPFTCGRKTPSQNHGNTEEWTSYAPNCTPRLTKAALTQETRLPFAEEQFPHRKQKLFSRFLSVCAQNLLGGGLGCVGAIRRIVP